MFNRRETNISKSILASRQRDEKLQGICDTVNQTRAYQRYINFDAKAASLVQKTKIMKIAENLKREDEQSLLRRRQRLAVLLREDDATFKQEIDASVETIDKRKERMAKRALQLREKREIQRKQKADQLYYQRFKLGCDELRSVEAVKHKKLIMQERSEQLELNRKLREQKEQEEKRYTQMWIEEGKKKQERHLSDVARLNYLNQTQASNLQQQIRHKEAQREAERQRILREKQAIKEQGEADRRLAEERRRQQMAEQAKRNMQTKRYNQLRQMQKNMQRRAELNDGEELNRINKEAMEKERQDAFNRKMQNKKETLQYLDHVRQMKEREAQYQKELDQHIQNEVDRGNHKRDMELQRRDMARRKLMDEVDQDRRRNLAIKDERRMDALKQKALDKEEMDRFEEEYKRSKADDGRDAFIRNKQVQADQLKLIAQKQQRRELEKAIAIHEKEYIDRAEAALAYHIEKEKNDPSVKKPWHGLTKDNWYS
mmetsp:Transcript_40870/g.65699  ORF Transcript_40870/g.65699 Transcript_40870/m.65699 type:complete len:487 (-) Transcript_40870:236-1696(-)